VAETDGFEPSVEFYSYGGLANRWFKPLTHVSIITNCNMLLKAFLASVGNNYNVDLHTDLLAKNHISHSSKHHRIHYVFGILDEILYREA
jgi:hypothetical protein